MQYLTDHTLEEGEGQISIEEKFNAYFKFLASIKDQLAPNAYAFATAPWHYDFSDHRCPHDAWVEALNILEISSGDRQEKRSIEIKVRLLGAYHDGYIELYYTGVKSYFLSSPAEFRLPPFGVGHGDWLVDEVRVSDLGFVLHEVNFSRGSTWLIECEDIHCNWETK